MRKPCLLVVIAGALGCSSSSSSSPDAGPGDAGAVRTVVVNELYASGSSATVPDWVELKNLTTADVDLTGYQARDKKLSNLTALPDHTVVAAGGYLVINCGAPPEAGVVDGPYVAFKLSHGKGDEFHLVGPTGADADSAIFGVDVPSDKSWGRLPDGTGGFVPTTPTRGASNI